MAEATFSLDLHVLGTPPAFILSQDQTLQLNPVRSGPAKTLGGFFADFWMDPDEPDPTRPPPKRGHVIILTVDVSI
jgi:hypothetical protein